MHFTYKKATAPTIRQKNMLYKNRAVNHKVAAKAAEVNITFMCACIKLILFIQKTKAVSKVNYSVWVIALLCFAMFGGGKIRFIMCQFKLISK